MHYVLMNVAEDNRLAVIRGLTGPLGTWINLRPERPAPSAADRLYPRMPPWATIKPAEIERMAAARVQQQT